MTIQCDRCGAMEPLKSNGTLPERWALFHHKLYLKVMHRALCPDCTDDVAQFIQQPATANTQQVNTRPPKSAKEREKEFSEAVERVYRKYGDNLAAFLHDIQKEGA